MFRGLGGLWLDNIKVVHTEKTAPPPPPPYLIYSDLLYAGWAAAWKESAVVGVAVHIKHEHFNPTENFEGDD